MTVEAKLNNIQITVNNKTLNIDAAEAKTIRMILNNIFNTSDDVYLQYPFETPANPVPFFKNTSYPFFGKPFWIMVRWNHYNPTLLITDKKMD